ncbi:MAG: hypothetical protein QMC67_13200 [Candidatus Wallbacteria bacterium]
MDQILKIFTLWILSISYWLIKGRCTEKAETAAAIPADNPTINSQAHLISEPLQNGYNKDNSIISAGLSELIQRRKVRTNQGQRKEDKKIGKN